STPTWLSWMSLPSTTLPEPPDSITPPDEFAQDAPQNGVFGPIAFRSAAVVPPMTLFEDPMTEIPYSLGPAPSGLPIRLPAIVSPPPPEITIAVPNPGIDSPRT